MNLFSKKQVDINNYQGVVISSVLRHSVSVQSKISIKDSLNGAELKLWLALKDLQLGSISYSPDQREIAKLLNTTQSTISRRLKILRSLRLIAIESDNHSISSHKQNLRGKQVIRVYENVTSIQEVLKVDQNYVVFLAEHSKSGCTRLRQICKKELYELEQSVLQQFNIVIDDDGQVTQLLQKKESPTSETEDKDQTLIENTSIAVKPHNKPLCTDDLSLCTKLPPLCTKLPPLCTKLPPLCTDEKPLISRYARLHNEEKWSYIYNHARAPTQIRINNLKIIYDNHPNLGGSGGKFDFFNEERICKLSEVVVERYGKQSLHAIHNLLKRGKYHENSAEAFTYQIKPDDVEVILTSLIANSVNYPTRYVLTLISKASQGLLAFQRGEHQLFKRIVGISEQQKKINEHKAMRYAKKMAQIDLVDGTKLRGNKSGEVLEVTNGIILGKGKSNLDGVRMIGVTRLDEMKKLILQGHWEIISD